MLKGPYTAIIVSVLLHLILLFVLIYSSLNPPKVIKQEKPQVTAIKSFLYSAAKKAPAKKLVPQVAPKQTTPKKTTALSPTDNQKAKVDIKKLPEKSTKKTLPTQVKNAVKSDTVTIKNKASGVSRGKFSSYNRLSQLRKSLDNQQRDKAFAELTQQRSTSIMDGDPLPVPKSLIPLTADQQHKGNTSTSHVGSITKNDNGTCTIHRAQIYGSPVEATTASFACGESQFDKSFRQHMEQVQAKIGTGKKE